MFHVKHIYIFSNNIKGALYCGKVKFTHKKQWVIKKIVLYNHLKKKRQYLSNKFYYLFIRVFHMISIPEYKGLY